MEDVFTQNLMGPPQNYQGHPRKKKSEKTSPSGEVQEKLTTEYNVISWIRFFRKKKCISKNEKVWLKYFFNSVIRVPIVAGHKWIQLVSMRVQIWSLVLLSGSGIWHYHELWCKSLIWLGSHVAVAVVYLWFELPKAVVANIKSKKQIAKGQKSNNDG